jgi:cation diffusion facilitator CzcD-associated flavoprotein CzcO
VTGGVREVRRNSVVGEDGVEREVDAIVFGTGFQVTEMPASKLVVGRDGERLSDVWAGSPRSHRGSTVPGFPNLFMLLGPNTGLGHNSMVYMIESQIAYVLDAMRVMRERGAVVAEVRPETIEGWNASIDERMEGTVWTTGCKSWYQDATGRNGAIWPDWTWKFRRETARFDDDGYELRAPRPARVPVPA